MATYTNLSVKWSEGERSVLYPLPLVQQLLRRPSFLEGKVESLHQLLRMMDGTGDSPDIDNFNHVLIDWEARTIQARLDSGVNLRNWMGHYLHYSFEDAPLEFFESQGRTPDYELDDTCSLSLLLHLRRAGRVIGLQDLESGEVMPLPDASDSEIVGDYFRKEGNQVFYRDLQGYYDWCILVDIEPWTLSVKSLPLGSASSR